MYWYSRQIGSQNFGPTFVTDTIFLLNNLTVFVPLSI